MFKQKLFSCSMGVLIIILSNISCTSQPVAIPPGEQVMPYPFFMALKNDLLLINSANTDGRFSHGRMVGINTLELDKALKGNGAKTPIPWSSVVTSNTMIPNAAGMMSLDGDLVFASSANNRLYKVPMSESGFVCNNPGQSVEQCQEALSLSLSELDPLAVQVISNGAEEIVAVSYWSSPRIDIISHSKSSPMKVLKHFDAADFIKSKTSAKISSDEIVVTKKIQVENGLVYFLLERISNDVVSRSALKGAYLVAISPADLLKFDSIPESAIKLYNLKDNYFIAGVHDMFVDGTNEIAYILGRSPEALFKINLKTSVLMDTATACMSASSLAVSKANNRIIMPCFKDNRVASFTMSPLALDTTSAIHGQGPIYAVIDERKKYIYVSFFNDGKVAIFDEELKYLGHVFEPVSANGMGS